MPIPYMKPREMEMFDYEVYHVDGMMFRGPGPKYLEPKSYIACIGASQTFGRYCKNPFPKQLSETLGFPVLNMGIGGADIGIFSKSPYLDVINNSALVVVQTMSARTESNSMIESIFGVHTRHKKSGVEKHINKHIQDYIDSGAKWYDVATLKYESKLSYFKSHVKFANMIKVPSLFFWFSRIYPIDNFGNNYSDRIQSEGQFPHWVDRDLYWNVARLFDGSVQCVHDDTKRHVLEDGQEDRYYYTQDMQDRASKTLAMQIQRNYSWVIDSSVGPSICTSKSDDDVRLWIVANDRTGSTLLSHALSNLLNIGDPIFKEHLRKTKIDGFFHYKRTKLIADYFRQHFQFNEVESLLKAQPSMKFVRLDRKDIVGRAISRYVAFTLKQWHVKKGNQNKYISTELSIDDEALYGNYRFCRDWKTLENFFSYVPHDRVIEVDYDEINNHLAETIQRILGFIGVEKTDGEIQNAISRVELVPCKRPESDAMRKRLEELIAEREKQPLNKT